MPLTSGRPHCDKTNAACRSKYAPNHYQLCSCDDAPLEDAFHVLFDCARHADTARADLLRASARWCTRANVPHDCDGRRAALHWAMTDQGVLARYRGSGTAFWGVLAIEGNGLAL